MYSHNGIFRASSIITNNLVSYCSIYWKPLQTSPPGQV